MLQWSNFRKKNNKKQKGPKPELIRFRVKTNQMKDKITEKVIKITATDDSRRNLSSFEAVAISGVAIMAVMAGTMLGDKLF